MSYYCLVSSAYVGHLNPMTSLGRELSRRGHRVVVAAPLDGKQKVVKAGLEFTPIATKEFPEGEWQHSTAREGELIGLKASRFIGHWLGRFTQGLLRDFPVIARRENFDGVVMDQVALGTESVCGVLKLPLAVACCALTLHAESRVPPMIFCWAYGTCLGARLRNQIGTLIAYSTGWPVSYRLAAYRLKHRLPLMGFNYVNQLPPSLIQVSQQPDFFDFPRRALPDHFHYTAPWKERADEKDIEFPWHRLDGRPLIYASLGTLQNRLDHVFRLIAEACADMPAQLVLALGRKGAACPDNLPGNPVVVDYAPQTQVLKHARMVITHGGLNTTLETLSEGLPMVAIPIANDQPGVSARLAHLGLGEFIPVKKITAEGLRTAAMRVLNGESYRQNASLLGKTMRKLNGSAMAAQLLEIAFKTKQRIRREGRIQFDVRAMSQEGIEVGK